MFTLTLSGRHCENNDHDCCEAHHACIETMQGLLDVEHYIISRDTFKNVYKYTTTPPRSTLLFVIPSPGEYRTMRRRLVYIRYFDTLYAVYCT